MVSANGRIPVYINRQSKSPFSAPIFRTVLFLIDAFGTAFSARR
jgi:hypothetical protein